MKFLNCNSATRISRRNSPHRPPISATILFAMMIILSISANTAGGVDTSDLATIPPDDNKGKAGVSSINNDMITPKIAKKHAKQTNMKEMTDTAASATSTRMLKHTAQAGTNKTQILVVVDMENAYCSLEVCGEWYTPVRDDGPGYSFTPRSWLGPACGNKCKNKKDCWEQAANEKNKTSRAPGFNKSVRTMKCEQGICACDSVPSEKDVIKSITKIIGATKVSDNSPYWDHIIFTHDWNDYGQVCSGEVSEDQCWKQSAQHNSTTCGNDTKSGCTSSLVAWSKGAEIVKPLQDAVDKAFALDSGMQSDKVHHVVKKHANWGLARYQSMNKVTEAQGKRTPYYLLEDLNISPEDTRLTVAGSFTQYCVMAGVFQMVLAGYDDIVIAEAATGGYMDSQAVKLCEKGQAEDAPCPRPPPSKTATFGEWSAWMARTGQGEGNYEIPSNSVNNVQTTKANALSWMKDIGVTVKKSKKGEPLKKGWKKYTDWMNDQGVCVPECFIEDWCSLSPYDELKTDLISLN